MLARYVLWLGVADRRTCCQLDRLTSGDCRQFKLEFHGTDTDTDTDILADFRARMSACPATSPFSLPRAGHARTAILANLSADLSDTRAFPLENVRQGCARVHV